jgi:predicted nucleic acid-binding protein
MKDRVFIDTNLWIYLLLKSKDPEDIKKKDKVKFLIEEYTNKVVSIQVLNEISNVLFKKYQIKTEEIIEYLKKILDITELNLITEENTFNALSLIDKYCLYFYDALIVSSALDAKCTTLFSEDMQEGQIIENKLQIISI